MRQIGDASLRHGCEQSDDRQMTTWSCPEFMQINTGNRQAQNRRGMRWQGRGKGSRYQWAPAV